MLDSLAPARRRLVLVVTGLLAVLLVAGVTVAALGREQAADPVAQTTLGPVVLVPGYGGSTTALTVLAEALRADGRDATVVTLAGDGTGDLVAQARVVDEAVRAVLARTGAPSADLVGYSAGGVIVRLWVKDLGGAALARRVLTLSSPHHGTDVAGLASDLAPDRCPEACVQLAPGSDLLRKLNAGDETPAGPVWVSIWTVDDRTVVPPTSADLDGALDFSVQSVCPDARVSHGDMPRDPVVIAMAEAVLGPALPELPDGSVCS